MPSQLMSYIAPSAPATRRYADPDLPFLRPEIGFTPNWYNRALGIDFGPRWHNDPKYRRDAVIAMRAELKKRFPGTSIGRIDRPDTPLDILTGTYGACTVAAIYGLPIIYSPDNWPNCKHQYLNNAQTETLRTPDLDNNSFFQNLMAQLDWIENHENRLEGFINWQGVLNNAHRLRGENLFLDMVGEPQRARHLFECICTTMIDAARRLHERQRQTGVSIGFFTVSNCLVNMVSPQQYRDLLWPLDRKIAENFDCIGIHNCAWNADPYLDAYARIPNVAYIDMGLDSDLEKARRLFPRARRALMYKPTHLQNKPIPPIRADLEKLACEYAPCDVVLADIEADTPDQRVLHFIEICREISQTRSSI